MSQIIIIYATDYGNTKKAAEEVAKGAQSVPGTEVILKTAEAAIPEDLKASNGVIVGSPVHMGSPDWRVKKFIDSVCSPLWMRDALIGKVAGVFTTGGGYGNAGGGCELTMLALLNNFAELGMLIVPLPKNTPGYARGGLQWGPHARSAGENMEQTGVQPESLLACWHHGANIARVTLALEGRELFAKPI